MKKMSQQTFRIGDLAKNLNVETSVIRFWEKEFAVYAQRSEGQQRFYTEKELEQFSKIKELLYEKKFTIAGAKAALKQTGPTHAINDIKIIPSSIQKDELLKLHDQLVKLRELL